jgi:uncharacterized membrane protein
MLATLPMRRIERSSAYWILLAATLAWIGLVFLAPWAKARGLVAGPLLYLFFDSVCHQLPERSFEAFGHPLAVCHRCFGLYLGTALGLLALPWLPGLRQRLMAQPRWLLVALVPLVVDALLLPNTPVSRFVTGLIASFPFALFVWAGAAGVMTAVAARLQNQEEPSHAG